MVRHFPLCNQQIQQGCAYFQQNDIYHQRIEDLEGSIRVMAEGRTRYFGGSIRQVQRFLATTFAGTAQDYKYWKCSPTAFRIQLPHTLSRFLVIQEGNVWGEQHGWRFTEWDTDWDARHQVKPYRVRVRVTEFPEEFWHPFFIQQLVAQFGEIESTDEENIQGPNHMNLHLWVRIIDPRRIPYFSVLPYGCQWKECTITVIAWEFIGEMPADADLPPPEDNGNRYGPYAQDNEYYLRQSLLQFHDSLTAAHHSQLR